jgi:signal transduction histidine kinase
MREFVTRLGRRLALEEAFGWPTFWISAFVYFGTTVLFDSRRFGGSLGFWILGWALGQFVLLGWVVLFRKVTLGLAGLHWASVLKTLLIGTTAGIARGYFMGAFSTALGIATEPQWGFRLGGGAVAGLVLTVAGAGLIGASIEHHAVVSRLTATQKLLLEARKNAPRTLDNARAEITELARRTIGPRIEEIELALSKAKLNDSEFNNIAGDIRALINAEVRPTVSSLALRVERTLAETPLSPKPPRTSLGLPRRINVSEAISPQISLGIALMLSLSTFAPLADPVTTGLSVVGALLLGITLEIFRRLFSKATAWPHLPATLTLAALGAISTIPLSLLTQLSLSKAENLGALPIQSGFIMAVLLVGIGFTRVVDNERRKYQVDLEQFNRELEREKSWIETQYWVIRREWAYLLHGRVQSSLTAAISRIGSAKKIDAATLKLVKQDVGRARAAIQNGVNTPFDLDSALAEIVESWIGVCGVRLEVSPDATRVVKADNGIGRALNELVREAVSNAVRHGYAENVTIKIDLAGGVLAFSATNDGKPVTKKSRASLGTEMLNELTLDWSLRNKPTGVVLEAKLATATSSSF